MKKNMVNQSRRRLLSGTTGAIALGAGASMLPLQANAQSGGFRALVCVFLYGGNDGINMTPPVAADANQRYRAVRGSLALASSNTIDLNGQIGLHGALQPLVPHWHDQSLAIVNNVGVLSRPTSQEDFFAWKGSSDSSLVPDNLFSHSDQQILWETATTSAMTRSGWGGRLMELLGNNSPVYGFGKPSRFGEGEFSQPLSLPPAGSELGLQGFGNGNRWAEARLAALQQLVAQGSGNQLQTGFSHAQFSAFETSALLGDILAQTPVAGSADSANPELSEAFEHFGGTADNELSRQLYHHANQINRHQELFSILGPALASFQKAMAALGMADQVTSFTQSDFGRTFKPNSSGGTDHGWGNQQLVLGGAVAGGQAHGVYPSPELGGPDDSGEKSWEQQGRWIPGIATDQYLASLIDWFSPELGTGINDVLPNIGNFNSNALGLMRS